jgi:hypothetical protein
MTVDQTLDEEDLSLLKVVGATVVVGQRDTNDEGFSDLRGLGTFSRLSHSTLTSLDKVWQGPQTIQLAISNLLLFVLVDQRWISLYYCALI